MKVAFFEVHDWEKAYLKKRLKQRFDFVGDPLTTDNVKKFRSVEVISVFIYSKVTKEIIDSMPKLKLITSRSTGYDHIDVAYAKQKGISVCTVPFYGENTVAEHAFALILSLSRNIYKSYLRSKQGDYSLEGLKGFDLKGKTIGLVGGGHIGMHVARMAKGFDMKVLVYDVFKQPFMSEIIGFEYASLEELLKKSDVISLHVPYNKFTHHLINRDNIKLIKKGAILINTARGGVVETAALQEALDKGILRGAGLDVLEGEQLIMEEKELLHNTTNSELMEELVRNHIILRRDNVVFTPHIAFFSQEALERILDTTIENIQGYINKKPINVVKL
jgi:D-lactate dehydrogenase